MARVLTKQVLPNEQRTTRLVFRNFPLKNHDWALIAAHAAACAQQQNDRYSGVCAVSFSSSNVSLGGMRRDTIMARVTGEIKRFRGFDRDRFLGCFASKRAAPKIDMDLAFGTLRGVTGTPTIFVNGELIASAGRTVIRRRFAAGCGDHLSAPAQGAGAAHPRTFPSRGPSTCSIASSHSCSLIGR